MLEFRDQTIHEVFTKTFHRMSVEFYVVVLFPGFEKAVGINPSVKPYLTNGVISIV